MHSLKHNIWICFSPIRANPMHWASSLPMRGNCNLASLWNVIPSMIVIASTFNIYVTLFLFQVILVAPLNAFSVFKYAFLKHTEYRPHCNRFNKHLKRVQTSNMTPQGERTFLLRISTFCYLGDFLSGSGKRLGFRILLQRCAPAASDNRLNFFFHLIISPSGQQAVSWTCCRYLACACNIFHIWHQH